jgi:hypothetical protein
MESGWTTFALLLVGLGLLVNPWVPGFHLGSETVHEYEAVSVEYQQGEGLDLRTVQDGQQLEPLSVDDEIACDGRSNQWMCRVALFVERNGSVPGYASAGAHFPTDYELVYLGDQFFYPTTVERAGRTHLALEPVNGSNPLRRVTTTDLTSLEERVVESGRVVTYQRLSRKHQLLRSGGEYYFVRQTAQNRYGGGPDRCHAVDDEFCERADWKRLTDTGLTVASRLAGLALVLTGWTRLQ